MSGFFRLMMKRKEVIPIVGIMAYSAIGSSSVAIYFLFHKNDVILNRSSNPEPWDQVDPTKPQKFVTINQKWEPVETLELVKSMTK
ncbi:normal mucosa of esophagus-specific gene 1 protein-like [Poeciliopsis prolifica]|uniref:normal mucosa of esophagus-specific gene 1 protein-like n=1 Tax=Poeciliopsis prolifica TaxID=188132 RepID=UPI00241378FC|nr:normal mucosa of esophagus-specific gene 1 protein-like [Poeciliopsis prolifica]XP_054901084.1 normal mucosa of esophagus-specific gene 1 protein-like [Poeciliopsis prolifica]